MDTFGGNQSHNLTAFYHSQYKGAHSVWTDGDWPRADDICRELVGDLACPPLLRVHAWQLRSRCTRKYREAKSYLMQALELLHKIPDILADVELSDKAMKDALELTQTMLDELETSCRDTQEARARKLPTEGPEGKEQAEVAAGEKH